MSDFMSAAKAVLSSTVAFLPVAKRLWAERAAKPDAHLIPSLDESFNDTLNRLSNDSIDAVWWNRLWVSFGHHAIATSELKTGTIRVLLEESWAREAFQATARSRLLGLPEDSSKTERLREHFTRISVAYEDVSAGQAIDVVVAVLIAGVFGELSTAQRKLASLVLDSHRSGVETLAAGQEEIKRGIEGLGPDAPTVKVHSEQAKKELRRCLRLQMVDSNEALLRLERLIDRIDQAYGDLRHANLEAKTMILDKAARWAATKDLAKAQDYLERLRNKDPSRDTTIIEALIDEKRGDVSGALKRLRDLETPDGRSILFAILLRSKGLEGARGWLEGMPDWSQPGFLTSIGYYNLVVALAQDGEWEQALVCIEMARDFQEDWPELIYLEGFLELVLLVPAGHRSTFWNHLLIDGEIQPLEGLEPDQRRKSATAAFEKALGTDLDDAHKGTVERALSWLRLTDSDPAVSQYEQAAIVARLDDPAVAARWIPMALGHGLDFDHKSIFDSVDRRRQLGGLNEEESSAFLLLVKKQLEDEEYLEFLSRPERKEGLEISDQVLLIEKIAALFGAEKIGAIKSLLEQEQGYIEEHFGRRVLFRIRSDLETLSGKDPRAELEAQYRETGELLDLKKLADSWVSHSDWEGALPWLRELFDQERNRRNALRLVNCLELIGADLDEVQRFFERNEDLVSGEPYLKLAKARSHFRFGELKAARSLVDELGQENWESPDEELIHLKINIALQGGDWGSFPRLVDGLWESRIDQAPDMLIRLSQLAAGFDINADRAFELIKLAVAKSKDDPAVLAFAIGMAFQLGKEGPDLDNWMKGALTSEHGPLERVDLKTAVTRVIPRRQEQERKVEKAFLSGAAPLFLVAKRLNLPISHLLINLPQQNRKLRDARTMPILPNFAGGRQPVSVPEHSVVGFDLSSLMLLFELDLLDHAVNSVAKAIIAPDTMVILLEESRRVRFHQPSQVVTAEEIRAILSTDGIRVAGIEGRPKELSEQIDDSLAELFYLAKGSGGVVVEPGPLYSAESYFRTKADLGSYSESHLSVFQFEALVYRAGLIESHEHRTARDYLAPRDLQQESRSDVSIRTQPIFLSRLGVIYLQKSGLLKPLVSSGLDLRVHPSVDREQLQLIESHKQGEKAASFIDGLRGALVRHLDSGRMAFLPRARSGSQESRLVDSHGTLAQFGMSTGNCDALCIDDRFVNSKNRLQDKSGKAVSVLCLLDFLSHLESKGILSKQRKWEKLNRLRKSGFAFVPVDSEELGFYFSESPWDFNGSLTEIGELGCIRRTLARLRVAGVVQANDVLFLSNIAYVAMESIRLAWANDDIPVERARGISSWILEHLMPRPDQWGLPSSQPEKLMTESLHLLSQLLNPRPILDWERDREYREWVERSVLGFLLPANPGLDAELAKIIETKIESWSSAIASELNQKKKFVARFLLKQQPASIREQLADAEEVRELFGLPTGLVFEPFPGKQVYNRKLLRSVLDLNGLGDSRKVETLQGEELEVEEQQDQILVRFREGKNAATEGYYELMILLQDQKKRCKAIDFLFTDCGVAALDLGNLKDELKSRQPTVQEFETLIENLSHSAFSIQNRFEGQVESGSGTVESLIPKDWEYYEQFCGLPPEGEDIDEYFQTELPLQRKRLLRRHLKIGLSFCLYGSLLDDLCPGQWVDELGLSDDELWKVIESLGPRLDPFSQLGLMDIAAYRLHDERFRGLVAVAIKRIWPSDSSDLATSPASTMGIVAEFIRERISWIPGSMTKNPTWRRLCVWTQASFLIDLCSRFGVDLKELSGQLVVSPLSLGGIAATVDARAEPLQKVEFHFLLPETLRMEFQLRIQLLVQRHDRQGNNLSEIEEVSTRIERMRPSKFLVLTGLLRGYKRPLVGGSYLDKLHDQATMDSRDSRTEVSHLALLSQSYKLNDERMAFVRELAVQWSPSGDAATDLQCLYEVVVVALAQGDKALAIQAAERLFDLAPDLNPVDTWSAGKLLVLASSSVPASDASNLLNVSLCRLAHLVAGGESSKAFYGFLQHLRVVLPVPFPYTEPEAIAASAF